MRTVETITKELDSLFSKMIEESPWLEEKLSFRLIGDRGNPALLDLDSPILKEYVDSFKKLKRSSSYFLLEQYPCSYSFPLLYAGTSTVSFGPKGGNFYRADKGVDLEEFFEAIALTVSLMRHWLKLDTLYIKERGVQ